MKYSERDLNILTLTVYGEARGEPHEGKLGVAWTPVNRAKADLWGDDRDDWWGEGVAGVCLRSWQYSCWNRPDQPQSQRERLLRFLEGGDLARGRLKPSARADGQFDACWRVASAVLDRREPDPTHGATHYYLEGSPQPFWAKGRIPVAQLGEHLFFNDVEDGYVRPAQASGAHVDGPTEHFRTIREHLTALETFIQEN